MTFMLIKFECERKRMGMGWYLEMTQLVPMMSPAPQRQKYFILHYEDGSRKD